MSRFYNEAFKWKLYGMYIDGYNCTKLSRMFKISDTALSTWFSQIENVLSLHTEFQTVGAMVGEIELLQKQVGFLTAEKALLHKSELMQGIPKASRIQAAQLLAPDYGPNVVCRMLDLQRLISTIIQLTARRRHPMKKETMCLFPALLNFCGNMTIQPAPNE